MVIRRATAADAAEIAEVWLRSYAAALPTVRRAHTDDEVRTWFADVVVPRLETWVAEAEGAVIGLVVLDGKDPAWQGPCGRAAAESGQAAAAGRVGIVDVPGEPRRTTILLTARVRRGGADIRYVWPPPKGLAHG